MCTDYLFNRAKLDHHLLVVRVALGSSAGPNRFLHQNIDFQALSFIASELKQITVFEEEIDILPLLNFVPIVMIFRGVCLGVDSGLNRLYLTIIFQNLWLFRNRWR